MQNILQQKHYSHCWQYQIRQKNLASDLIQANISQNDINQFRVSDFKFFHVPSDDKIMCERVKEFITKHEWLGNMHRRPTHRFIATYRGHIAGAIIMATPNSFSSSILGKENQNREKLISRGSCISWSPKNLSSSLLMYAIKWMIKNTQYRVFSGYSDPTAGEIGTIYQACNFIYLGQNWGSRFMYLDPNYHHKGYFSHRYFSKICTFKEIAREHGVEWKKGWSYRDEIFWDKIPLSVSKKIKDAPQIKRVRCQRVRIPRKHKYIYIAGKNKKDTMKWRKIFFQLNPDKKLFQYPKRGLRLLPNPQQ